VSTAKVCRKRKVILVFSLFLSGETTIDPACSFLVAQPPPATFVRYIDGMHGNMPESRKRWKKTLEFRAENAIEGILAEVRKSLMGIRWWGRWASCFLVWKVTW
jgi:hypothetical protein